MIRSLDRGPLIAFFLGCTVAFSLAGAFEFALRTSFKNDAAERINFDSISFELEKAPPLEGARTDWPLKRLPPDAVRAGRSFGPRRWIEDRRYKFLDPTVGFRPINRSRAHVQILDEASRPIYSVEYAFDNAGRREIGSHNMDGAPALFLGCSFTLGEGVAGDQTFAAEFGRNQTLFRPYVYAFHGWGPANLLGLVRTSDFGKDIAQRTRGTQRGMAVYTYIDHHVPRTVGGTSMMSQDRRWLASIPAYELSPAGLVTEGSFGETKPTLVEFYFQYQQLRKWSHLLGFLLPSLPIYSGQHFDLVAAVVAELKHAIRAKTGISQFYVLIFPGSKTARWIAPRLKARDIEVVDYSNLALEDYVAEPRIRNDGHPTAQSHAVVGKLLVQDLVR